MTIKCAACGRERERSEIGFMLGKDEATGKNGVYFLCADRKDCKANGAKYEAAAAAKGLEEEAT